VLNAEEMIGKKMNAAIPEKTLNPFENLSIRTETV
jgi:hypothetical protein